MSGRHYPSISHVRTININIKSTDTNNDKRPKSSRVSPDEIKPERRWVRDMETMAAEKLSEQATTLMKLKVICAVSIVLSVINSATFGTLTHAVIKRLDYNEQLTGTLQSQIAGEFVALSDIRRKVSELETNFSDTHLNHNFRIHQLETDLVADKYFVQKHEAQIQQLEIQTDNINGSTLQINNALDSLNATYYTDRQLYLAQPTSNLSLIEEFGERLKTLELNHTENFLAINDQATQLNEFERKLTVSQSLLHEHESQLLQIQANLTSKSLMIYSHNNDILALNSSIRQFENHFTAQNATINAVIERLSQLENETEEARRLTDIQDLKLEQQEEILVSANETLQAQNIRLVQLETGQKLNHDMIVNNSAKVVELEPNETLKLGLLEMDLLSLKDIIRNQTDKIEDMKADADAQNQSLYSNNMRLEELESRQNVDELQNVNQSVRIASLEFNRQSDLGRILEVEQIANATQQTLYDVNVILTNIKDGLNCSLGVWSNFSPCSHTCGSGTKYRTRSCQTTTEESKDWYPRTETDIQVCNDQACPALDCQEILQTSLTSTDGIYSVQLKETGEIIDVYCDMTTDGGGWTVFQKRFNGSVDFYRNWHDYENGFGQVTGEFWLGLKYIYQMTKDHTNELRIELEKSTGEKAYEVYQSFSISSSPRYTLSIGDNSGTAGDGGYGLSFNNGQHFSTYDMDQDGYSIANCAILDHGGWWYNFCAYANLNGEYVTPLRRWMGRCDILFLERHEITDSDKNDVSKEMK